MALSLVTAAGCRKALTPYADTNEPPETWITAAPMDTLTVRDGDGIPTGTPQITIIPVRFHLYWAGADKDGSIGGFYYAVVETTVTPDEGGYLPSLPSPKPGDYRFTPKTDTTFVFNVSELYTDRQHAFYIYAVDDKGKPDPTPAKFVFRALDKYPPTPVIDEAVATGAIVRLSPSGDPIPDVDVRHLTHVYDRFTDVADTAAAYSRLDFSWHAESRDPLMSVSEYRYKLDESSFQSVDSSVRAVSYGADPAGPVVTTGTKLFTLRALDQAGGAGETNRYFVTNYAPDTWWAGPNPADFTDAGDREYDSHSVVVAQWPTKEPGSQFTTVPPLPTGSYFGPDSFAYRPSKRFPPGGRPFDSRGTFYEIYKNRLYARSEGDTVHMNAYIVLWNGGYDKDSRYKIQADSTDPALRAADGSLVTGALLETETANGGRAGSPIGFRSLVVCRLTPSGLKNSPAQTTMYPIYEPASVFRSPVLGGYWRMFQAGKAYAVARAQDYEGAVDPSAGYDIAKLADDVDGGRGTSAQIAQRHKVLTFYVDKAPALVRDTLFRPYEGQVISTAQWDFYLKGMDLDPYDPTGLLSRGGGPTSTTIIRFRIRLYGASVYTGADTSWTYVGSNGLTYINLGSPVSLSFIPGGTMAKNPFASGPVRVSIQVCDCIDCEGNPGQGRCVNGIATYVGEPVSPSNVINVTYVRPALGAVLETSSTTSDRPGSASPGGGE
jgi:hypothetical protein